MPDPVATITGFRAVFKVLSIAPSVYEKLNEWRGKPSKQERERLVIYTRRLDERRVFRVPLDVEVADSCVWSLSQVKEYTDAALAELEHPAARAALGAILDVLRGFLDEWQGRRRPDPFGWGSRGRDGEVSAFYEDLGELRGKMRQLVSLITALEPRATCPMLLAADPHGREARESSGSRPPES